jgi:hypothetical protein
MEQSEGDESPAERDEPFGSPVSPPADEGYATDSIAYVEAEMHARYGCMI